MIFLTKYLPVSPCPISSVLLSFDKHSTGFISPVALGTYSFFLLYVTMQIHNLLNSHLRSNLCLLQVHIPYIGRYGRIVSNLPWYFHNTNTFLNSDRRLELPRTLFHTFDICNTFGVWTHKISVSGLLLQDACFSSYLWHLMFPLRYEMAWFSLSLLSSDASSCFWCL